MTKEEIIEECKQRLGFETDCEMYSLCQHEKDFYNAIIKALEQQPSDDCVSRQAVDQNIYDYAESNGLSYANLKNAILDVPPVTPTYGTCKDCKHRDPEDKKCDCGHAIAWQMPRPDNWYCADFKKRGNENG